MISSAPRSIHELLQASPFTGYAYSYPHKTAYRRLDPPVPLADVWAEEDKQSLFLYVHIPFCEFRCGFCNLFTLSQPETSLPNAYLQAVQRQATVMAETLGDDIGFARLAFGGGTPTFLSTSELGILFDTLSQTLGVDGRSIPFSCEASPATLDEEKLALLAGQGVDRISLGIQSFNEGRTHAMGRPQRIADVHRALDLIRSYKFPILNVDLIYGEQGHDLREWQRTVQQAIDIGAEEIYLYPLYVRQQTGLGKVSAPEWLTPGMSPEWDQQRLQAYRQARSQLLENGYDQHSLRMFQRRTANPQKGPVYRCQEDGMVGLGCGARSYTSQLHYSHEYAVGSRATADILSNYVSRDEQSFRVAEHGVHLDLQEQRRRHVILSLLQVEGFVLTDYRQRFGGDALEDFPELGQLVRHELACHEGDVLQLTPTGLERSDAIGPWLYSASVQQRMETYRWRAG